MSTLSNIEIVFFIITGFPEIVAISRRPRSLFIVWNKVCTDTYSQITNQRYTKEILCFKKYDKIVTNNLVSIRTISHIKVRFYLRLDKGGHAMFGLGLPEILFILVMILLFIGPKKLPGIGKSIGKALSEFKEVFLQDRGKN